MAFLQNRRGHLTDGKNKPLRLRGVNLGNWLMLEGFMLGGPNEPEHCIRKSMAEAIGLRETRAFFKNFQDVYIQSFRPAAHPALGI